MDKLILGFLGSHSGSNMQAIIDNCKSGEVNAIPAVVISNNSDAYILERGRLEGLNTYHISNKKYTNQDDLDTAIIDAFEQNGVNLVILAGYMRKIGTKLLMHYKNRVLNIHPALLPKYGGEGMYGMNVHKAVIEAYEKESGATIHLVNEIYDSGRILLQGKVEVLENDSPESLQARVLEIEHKIYSEAINKIALGEFIL